jgi:hypothetical protein
MTNEPDDVLSREVTVRANLDENGLEVASRSRMVAAFDRMLGSIMDWPAAFFEGKARKRRVRDAIHEQLLKVEGNAASARAIGMPTIGDRLLGNMLNDEARKLGNRASVTIEAADALKQLPPPADPSDEEQSSNRTAKVGEDWMNAFVRYAEDASSEDLQRLWGRVLAGEIKRPGAFSRRTLRFMAELDDETARGCETISQSAIANYVLAPSDKWARGELLELCLEIQNLGLIEGVGANVNHRLEVDENGSASFIGNTHALAIRGTPGFLLPFDALPLTRLGREVFSLLPRPDEEKLLTELAERFPKDKLTRIEIGHFVRTHSAGGLLNDQRVIWEKDGLTPSPVG